MISIIGLLIPIVLPWWLLSIDDDGLAVVDDDKNIFEEDDKDGSCCCCRLNGEEVVQSRIDVDDVSDDDN